MRQEEGAVVPEVVADKPLRHRRLGRARLHRRVRIDRALRGVEAGIGYAVNARPAVVIRDLLQQPFHRVVRVAGFVGVLRCFLVRLVRPDMLELPL